MLNRIVDAGRIAFPACMAPGKDEVLRSMIYPAMAEIAESLPDPAAFAADPATRLFGREAALDSLALVSFIVLVEERIETATSQSVRLVTEQAMSRSSSPFRSVGTLADYIVELLQPTP